jgi:aminoglycoside phosphotransferase (APT) family kinase protein
VPVPRVLAVAQTGEVLDVPLYVMCHVPGHVVTDELPSAFDPRTASRTMTFALVDCLAHLHAVDFTTCGLTGFGRPDDFNGRHLKRIEALMLQRDGPVPTPLAEMARFLKQRVPKESGAAIVHNDYRLGNVIWSQNAPPRLLAILDWELATLGDPLLDLGYFACCYPVAGEALNPTQQLSTALLASNGPTRDEIFTRYGTTTGRDLSSINWYAAMSAWKLAVLYDYQHRLGRDQYYADDTQVPRFLASAALFAGNL